MAVLFAASEAESFTVVNPTNLTASTSGTDIDTNFARAGMKLKGNATLRHDLASPVTELWCHFRFRLEAAGSSSDDNLVEFIDTGTGQTVVQIDGDNGTFNLEYWNGSSFTSITPSFVIDTSQHEIDFHAKIADVGGVFEWFLDGVLVARFSGDTLLSGFTQIDRIEIKNPNAVNNSSVEECIVSEVIITDSGTGDTRNMRLATHDPTGNGTNTAWTNAVTEVDEAGVNDDTDFITSGTATQKETYAARDLTATADNFQIVAVVLGVRGRNDGGGGPQNIAPVIRSGGTDFVGSNLSGITTAFAPLSQHILAADPNTTAAWTPSAVNAMEIGVQSAT